MKSIFSPLFLVFLTALVFFSFGLFRLGQFETTDEHLWKYDRIGTYWEALLSGDFAKTAINDKPGITVALFSGLGLLSYPEPETTERLALPSSEESQLFEAYNIALSEPVNRAFRLPVLVVSTLALFAAFFLLRAAFGPRIALFTTLFIGTSPILVGISQIVNPDSFFWIFGSLSVFSYLALLETNRKILILVTGILLGLALLSKYTSFLLFGFFALALMTRWIFFSTHLAWSEVRTSVIDLLKITLAAFATFSLFLPAVFTEPETLFKGISQFLSVKDLPIFVMVLAVIGAAGFWLVSRFGQEAPERVRAFFASWRIGLIRTVSLCTLVMIGLALINAWTNESFFPVSELRDRAYANEPQSFNFKPVFTKETSWLEKIPALAIMEITPLVFSLALPLLITLTLGLLALFSATLGQKNQGVLFAIFVFTIVYFTAAYIAGVVVNARYAIILYPLLALAGGIIMSEWMKRLRPSDERVFLSCSLLLILFGGATLFSIKPYYFSYTNSLLPDHLSIHDSWGHGSYEAAQYLNSLPNAKNTIIWSNSDTVCRFFEGKCLRSRRIDLGMVTPDYFVLSKRGVIKEGNHFVLENNPIPERDARFYIDRLTTDSVWSLEILNRPDNFIRIIPFQKP